MAGRGWCNSHYTASTGWPDLCERKQMATPDICKPTWQVPAVGSPIREDISEAYYGAGNLLLAAEIIRKSILDVSNADTRPGTALLILNQWNYIRFNSSFAWNAIHKVNVVLNNVSRGRAFGSVFGSSADRAACNFAGNVLAALDQHAAMSDWSKWLSENGMQRMPTPEELMWINEDVRKAASAIQMLNLPDINAIYEHMQDEATKGSKANSVGNGEDHSLLPGSTASSSQINRGGEGRTTGETNEAKSCKAKRSTNPGEARLKLIAALTKHHQYADGGCLNMEPIGVNELQRMAQIGSSSTSSKFFEKEFHGHAKYRAACRDATKLVYSLKLLNGEFSPYELFGRSPQDEDDRAARNDGRSE